MVKTGHNHSLFWGPTPSPHSYLIILQNVIEDSLLNCRGEGQICALQRVYCWFLNYRVELHRCITRPAFTVQ